MNYDSDRTRMQYSFLPSVVIARKKKISITTKHDTFLKIAVNIRNFDTHGHTNQHYLLYFFSVSLISYGFRLSCSALAVLNHEIIFNIMWLNIHRVTKTAWSRWGWPQNIYKFDLFSVNAVCQTHNSLMGQLIC